jgi:hypothetical protein
VWQWEACVTTDTAAVVGLYLLRYYLNVLFLFPVHIKDALESDCSKCSEAQKSGAKKVLSFLYKNKPDKFKELQKKYDPDNTHYHKYEYMIKD